jgi:hypothetical protein
MNGSEQPDLTPRIDLYPPGLSGRILCRQTLFTAHFRRYFCLRPNFRKLNVRRNRTPHRIAVA